MSKRFNLFKLKRRNAFYAQSGGVTAVINSSARGVIEECRRHHIKLYAGKNGILGALNEELIDTSKEKLANIKALRATPGGAFGSARFKLKSIKEDRALYERLVKVFKAHNIGYFFYNGGGDSQDTAYKVSQIGEELGYPLTCIGIPKTMDNDLPFTDTCPGFGSVAKYVATSIREVGLDLKSMAATSTKVFILEVMGRHAGWTAAAAGLAYERDGHSPHIILFPEAVFDEKDFLERVDKCVKKHGHCCVIASEGVKDKHGKFLADAGGVDAFGHIQLGGVAPLIANLVKHKLGYKEHWAVADYLMRAARHIASKTDLDQAYALGRAAVKAALAGKNNIMMTIVRKSDKPYRWKIGEVALSKVANVEKKMPRSYITRDGYHITQKCRDYMLPLIAGEEPPPFKNGLPIFVDLKNVLVRKKLPKFE